MGTACQNMKLSCCSHYRKHWWCRHNLNAILSLQQIHQVPLPWIQEESKQRKPISFFIAWSPFKPTQNPSLQTVDMALLSGLPPLACLSAPSLCLIFVGFLLLASFQPSKKSSPGQTQLPRCLDCSLVILQPLCSARTCFDGWGNSWLFLNKFEGTY